MRIKISIDSATGDELRAFIDALGESTGDSAFTELDRGAEERYGDTRFKAETPYLPEWEGGMVTAEFAKQLRNKRVEALTPEQVTRANEAVDRLHDDLFSGEQP